LGGGGPGKWRLYGDARWLPKSSSRCRLARRPRTRQAPSSLRSPAEPPGAGAGERSRWSAQQVLSLRKAGRSLRGIVMATGLSLQTVRNILGKRPGRKPEQEAIAQAVLKAERQRAWRQRRQSIEALPRQLNAALQAGAELTKRARKGARRL